MSHSQTSHTPLVTAIVVTRNQESHIRECLRGLMEQTVADRMEVIVVDRGSEQAEAAIVADLQRSHGNVIALRTSGVGSRQAGVNLAVRIASGKYLTILDAADRMRNDAYQVMAAALDENTDAMLAYGDTCWTAVANETFARHTSLGKMIWPEYTPQQLAQLPQVAPHPMWRRELHDAIGALPEGADAVRELLLVTADRFRMLHVQEFTGLKMMAAEGASRQVASVQREQQVHREQQSVARPSESNYTAAVVNEPAPGPTMGADEAYAAIEPLLTADEQQAMQALEKHLQSYPEHSVAHNDLGAICYQLGDNEKALRHYRKAVELGPEETTYQKNLADMLFVVAGQVDEAIAIYLQLLNNAPRDVETLLNLGIICHSVGQPAEAETFLQRALEIEPWNQVVRERLTELRESQAEDEQSAEDHYEKAQSLVAQGDLDGAERELEDTVAAYPDFAPAHNDLAVIQYQKGDKDQALAHYEKAAALVPGNNTFQKNLADFYFVEGRNVDGAIAIYLEQLRKEPRNVETLMSLGQICSMLDRPQEAETFYGKVTELEPWNQTARECLSNLRHCANG